MSIPADIKAILAAGYQLLGTPSQVVITATGETLEALAGKATLNDTALGSGQQINGTEQTLRFLAEEAPGLEAGSKLRWNKANWEVKFVLLQGQGLFKKVFLLEDQ